MITATCTWGDGPDVLLSLTNKVFFNTAPVENVHSIHGICRHGSVDLTIGEAEELANQLLCAANQARMLNQLAEREG